MNLNNLTNLTHRLCRNHNIFQFAFTSQRFYAKPVVSGLGKKSTKLGKVGPIVEKKVLPVETDPKKLVNYVCGSNIFTTGEDVKIRPDAEYPEWLWKLHTGPPKQLNELDPETKEYWKKLRKLALRRNNTLQALKKF